MMTNQWNLFNIQYNSKNIKLPTLKKKCGNYPDSKKEILSKYMIINLIKKFIFNYKMQFFKIQSANAY